ncbi:MULTISPECIES: carbohydrate ABC transporter permease [Streptomyces]|uniref:carbohydrate ABC transporter permease n=1 Tax=Streptomyces TaxID=1883 RepID=UPI0002F73C08|nr:MULTISPECIES: carbohydrate ABC transporter permease [Streptomyces]
MTSHTTSTAAASLGSSRQPGRRSNVLTLLMLAFLIYFLLPLFWLIVSATKDNGSLFSTFGLWFGGGFDFFQNLHDVFTHDGGIYGRWLLNTALYAVVSSVGAAFLATLGGYAFAKFRFPGRNLLFSIVLGSIMVPSTVLTLPTYLLFSKIGLVNTPLAVIVPMLMSPFGLYLMRVYAEDAVPDSLIDAARMDGAGAIRIFWQVGFRLLLPGFVTVLLFQLVASWNNFFLPLIMLNNPKLYPMTIGLAQWQAQAGGVGGAQPLFSIVITGSLVSILPLVAAFLLLQRYWQGGLSTGSVKD